MLVDSDLIANTLKAQAPNLSFRDCIMREKVILFLLSREDIGCYRARFMP